MGFYDDLQTDLRYASWFNWWVLAIWCFQWVVALGFSRFARWTVQHGGRQLWASRVLLPVYESALVLKKVALLTMILTAGFSPDFTNNYSTGSFFALYAHVFALKLYDATYVAVLYVLYAESAGTVTLWRAIAATITVAVFNSILVTFEETGDVNLWISTYNNEKNTTMALWPSFSGGVGPSAFVTSAPMPSKHVTGRFIADIGVAFWLCVGEAAVGAVALAVYAAGRWQPRQPRLFATMSVLMFSMSVWNYCWFWQSLKSVFGFRPFVLLAIIEMPFKYYLMLLDSKVLSLPPQ